MTRATRARKTLARGTVAALVLSTLVLVPAPPVPQAFTGETITGTVYRDYNNNGTQEAIEPPVAGIQVTATDSNGNAVGPVATAADGTYTLDIGAIGSAAGETYRVEFSIPGAISYLDEGPVGTDNASSVQFVVADATGVDWGVHNASQYCQASPSVATTCYVGEGAPSPSTTDTVIDFVYTAGTTSRVSNNDAGGPGHGALAQEDDTGPVTGVAFHRESNSVITGAFAKRHTGYPGGTCPGGVNTPNDNGPDQLYVVDRDAVGAATAYSPADAGTDVHGYCTGLGGPTDPLNDTAFWDFAGKTAWGDLELSEDQNTLYAVNMFDRNVYAIPVVYNSGTDTISLTVASAVAIDYFNGGASPCADDDWVPGALKTHDGRIYASVTCTAETSQDRNDLFGYIYDFGPADTSITNLVLGPFDLGYSRNFISFQNASNVHYGNYQPWITTETLAPPAPSVGSPFGQVSYPQPWVFDIEFDETNAMIVGVRDRAGDQFGNDNASGGGNNEGVAGGDTIRFAATTPGAYSWPALANPMLPVDAAGLSGHDYFFEERYPLATGATHNETTLGSMALRLGDQRLITNAWDPPPVGGAVSCTVVTVPPCVTSPQSFRTGGITWYRNDNTVSPGSGGDRTQSYMVFPTDAPGSMGKAAGIGDLELLCDNAPIEIGNRIWLDTDFDGIQDPDEAPIANVVVDLYTSGGVFVATDTTDANGNYGFSSTSIALSTGTDYEVRINASNFAGGQPLDGLVATRTDTGGSDTIDSDGTQAANPIAAVSTGAAGANSHAVDFGFHVPIDLGDDPDTFGTTLTPGPSHVITAGLSLGALVDAEADGQPATAGNPPDGDDTDAGGDDEDGITLGAINGDTTTTITIDVTDSVAGDPTVNGWLDFNNNGTFEAGESIFAGGVYVSSSAGLSSAGLVTGGTGSYTVTINVPDFNTNGSGYSIGDDIYTRFRIASVAGDVASPTGTAASGEVEDHSGPIVTLPVSLAHVQASGSGGDVTIDWTTANEVDNLGFNVYAVAPDGGETQLNAELIHSAAPNSPEPQDYSFSTTAAPAGADLYLEDVSLGGVIERHGPFTLGEAWGAPLVGSGTDWEAAGEAAGAGAEPPVTFPAGYKGPVAQLDVTQAGLHRVTYEDLLAAGIDLAGSARGKLAVTRDGAPVALQVRGPFVVGPGTSIEFWGEPADTIYTDTGVYVLHLDRSQRLRVTREAATPPAAPATTAFSDVSDVDVQASYSVTAPGADPWSERRILSPGYPVGVDFTIPVDGDVIGTGAALDVTLWGVTHWPAADEHHVQASLNGTPVADVTFDDAVEHVISVSLPDGLVVAGDNTLRVTVVGDTGVPIDLVAVDTYAITFDRGLDADGAALDFTADGDRIEVTDLAARGDRVALLGDDGSLTYLKGQRGPDGSGGFEVAFDGGGELASYALIPKNAALPVPGIRHAPVGADLLSGSADYLVISHATFLGGLDPLVAHHTAAGLSVRVVDVAEVYEAYTGGEVDPVAIDEFVADAAATLGVDYVLLVGADSYDYLDHDGDGSFSFIPSPYGSTGFGITYAPLDPEYADTDGDGVPDLALGRFPAHDLAELGAMVDKTLTYAAGASGASALLVSDLDDGISYSGIADDLETELGGWSVERVDLDDTDVATARQQIIDGIDAGTSLTAFVGHSGASDWSNSGLFDVAAVASLANAGAPTVVAQFGCWNAYYVGAGGIAESLLTGDGGAAAVMGGATLTGAASDQAFAPLAVAELARPGARLGDAVLAAKQQLEAQNPGQVDIQLGWTLLGDPGVELPG